MAIKQKELIYQIVKERLAYRSPLAPFGERVERERSIKEKIKRLNAEERQFLSKEIERLKFERVRSWFEAFYR